MQRRNFLGSAGVFAAGLAAVEANAQSVIGAPNADAGAITEVPGVKVGHFTDARRPTGCTVIMTEEGAVGGVDVRGSAPGTRETDLLNPINLSRQGHGRDAGRRQRLRTRCGHRGDALPGRTQAGLQRGRRFCADRTGRDSV